MPPELTLVVAATRSMGIGRNGGLPWSGLKKEMAYFARVTKRLPPLAPPGSVNAVIMGRRTWESIPLRFRPLPGRLNIVLTSHPLDLQIEPQTGEQILAPPDVLAATSLDDALERARARGDAIQRVFVIGGAAVYGAALRRPEATRVLLTSIETDFECDVFFPLPLGRHGPEHGVEDAIGRQWERRPAAQLDNWVGEHVPDGTHTESGVEYEFQMWETAAEND